MVTRPDPATLFDLYNNQRLNYSQIAERYNVTRQTVSLWLAAEGVATRKSEGRPPRRPQGTPPRRPAQPATPSEPAPSPAPAFVGALEPVPPKRRGQPASRARERAFFRLSEQERKIVQRNVDAFLIWAEARKELANA